MTLQIENNANLVPGSPTYVPVDDGAVLLVVTPASGGTFSISYKVVGEVYPWYEYMFLGKDLWVYYLGVSGLTVLFFFIIASPVSLVTGLFSFVLLPTLVLFFAAFLLLLFVLPLLGITMLALRLLKKKDMKSFKTSVQKIKNAV